MAEFRMPSLGADMEAGTLVEWLVKPGDPVTRGDVIAVVETEKGAIEVEVFDSGVVESLLVETGQKVPVGTVLATLRDGAEPRTAAPAEPAATPAVTGDHRPPSTEAPSSKLQAPGSEPDTRHPEAPERLRVSPLARRMAEELGVDLSRIRGTGPGGAISREDVEQAAVALRAPQPARLQAPGSEADTRHPTPDTPDERVAAMRRAIAAAMGRSKREIPHYYLETAIDMTRALAWLETENQSRPVTERLLSAALLLKAVALAVRHVPEMNGFWTEDTFRPGEGVHLGVAISLRQGGLVAPAIHDADAKPLDALMRDLKDLVSRARAGKLRSSEISDPTITVTNLGDQGVETVFGVIYPPQVALVGFGRIRERAWAVDGMIGARPIITATLAADHRASDGHRGGLFLSAMDRLLQEPEKL